MKCEWEIALFLKYNQCNLKQVCINNVKLIKYYKYILDYFMYSLQSVCISAWP